MKAEPPHSTDTRERILDAAERLFAERGFAGTSVREITDAAAVNLGAVNYHFQSKENLYAEVFARRVAELRQPMAAVARDVGPIARQRPDQAFLTFGRVFLAPHQRRDTASRIVGLFAREMIEERLPPGYLKRLRRPTGKALTGLMQQVRPDMAESMARACADSFLAQLMHIVKGAHEAAGSVDAQLEHAVRFTVAAVRHIEGAPRKGARRLS